MDMRMDVMMGMMTNTKMFAMIATMVMNNRDFEHDATAGWFRMMSVIMYAVKNICSNDRASRNFDWNIQWFSMRHCHSSRFDDKNMMPNNMMMNNTMNNMMMSVMVNNDERDDERNDDFIVYNDERDADEQHALKMLRSWWAISSEFRIAMMFIGLHGVVLHCIVCMYVNTYDINKFDYY